jgi:hypothetical protein
MAWGMFTRSGACEVYRAQDTKLDRKVALKILRGNGC